MAASYVLAMTLIPAYCARFFHVEAESTGKRLAGLAKLSANFDKLQGVYERWLEMALVRPGWLLFGSGLVFLIALALYPLLGKELFPASDSGQFTVLVRAPSGTRIELTEQLVSRIENVVREVVSPRDLNTIVSNSGILYDWPAAYTPNAGPLDSFLNIQLSDNHRVSAQDYVLRLRQELAAKFPGVQFAFDTGGMLTAALSNGLPVPLDIQVTGNDLRVGQHIAREIEDRIHTVNGAVDVRIPEELDYPSINVNVDRVKAAYLGLDATDVVKNIVSALNSSVSFQPAFWIDEKNGNHYFLGVQDDQSARGLPSLSALQNIPLTDPKLQEGQEPTLVKNVATISRGVEPAEVQHRDMVRTTDVYVGVSARDLGSVATEIQQRIHGLHLPAGYTVDMRGEFESMQDSLGGLRFGLLMAVALIYLLLVAQFRSFLDPLIILFAVPLGLVGVIFTLLATGMTVNIQSYIGTIFMVGIAVSNSVLLVEFANRLRSGGMPVQQAVVQAGVIRLRPILMTSCAAMMGLLPMAFQIEPGGEANVPLARAVIGGLATSTLLTLFVVPSLYLVLKGRKH
jgi:multidrug efflux pump subunit AcrB